MDIVPNKALSLSPGSIRGHVHVLRNGLKMGMISQARKPKTINHKVDIDMDQDSDTAVLSLGCENRMD